jgi:hypothetical protein
MDASRRRKKGSVSLLHLTASLHALATVLTFTSDNNWQVTRLQAETFGAKVVEKDARYSLLSVLMSQLLLT